MERFSGSLTGCSIGYAFNGSCPNEWAVDATRRSRAGMSCLKINFDLLGLVNILLLIGAFCGMQQIERRSELDSSPLRAPGDGLANLILPFQEEQYLVRWKTKEQTSTPPLSWHNLNNLARCLELVQDYLEKRER